MNDCPENYSLHPAPVEDPPDPERLYGEPTRLRGVLLREAARGLLREYLRQLNRIRIERPDERPARQQDLAMHCVFGMVQQFAGVEATPYKPGALRRELEADDLPPVLAPRRAG